MTPADHPKTCTVCAGNGWQRGPDTTTRHSDGHILRTSPTVIPCQHHWADDDPHPEAIERSEYLARLGPRDPERQLWERFNSWGAA